MRKKRQTQLPSWVLVFLFIMLLLAVAYILYSQQPTEQPQEGRSREVHFIDEIGRAHV